MFGEDGDRAIDLLCWIAVIFAIIYIGFQFIPFLLS